MKRQYYVYIMASKRDGVLYIGVTNDLARRGDEHKTGNYGSFTGKYWIRRLVYYETFDTPEEAIRREKNLKAWQRGWKIRLIEEVNPSWRDLSSELLV